MISPLIKWDHSEDWFVTNFDDLHKVKSRERKVKVSLSEKDFEYIEGYTIDGNYASQASYLTKSLIFFRISTFASISIYFSCLGNSGFDE